MIRLTIDDQEISVPEGTMIVDAAAKLGIEVPIYCYHQALGPLGACRMCLVQVEKMPKLATGCTTAVTEGMVVHTHGPAVEKGRQGVIEFLLINHPLDCPICDKGGECFLQDYTFDYGPPAGRFNEPKIQKVKDGPINELVLIDQERCVLCQRCVRFMDEYVGEPELLLEGRGVETVVSTAENKPMISTFGGNVIDLCPVGALLSKPYHHKARPWNIEREESVCVLCPVGCTTLSTGRDGHVVRVEGRPVADREWGWLCDRGRFGYDFTYDKARLLNSRVEGQETSAVQATRDIGRWLKETVDSKGPQSVAFVMGGTHTTEEAYQLNLFARETVGTQRVAISRSEAGYLPRGLNGTFEDIKASDTVILLGVDPYEAVPVVHLKIREQLTHRAGFRLLGVGAMQLTRDSLPGQDLLVRPGEDALVMALALRQVAGDEPLVKSLTEALGDVKVSLGADELERLGRALLESEHLVLLWDGQTSDMASVLVTLAKLREKPTRVLPTFGPSNWRGYERAGISARFEDLTRILEDAKEGEIEMLFLWGADLLREYPDQQLVREALDRVRYVIAEAIVPPLGAEYLSALIPSAAWSEVYGTYVNMEGRLQVGMASVQPPGQARPTKTYLTAWARALQKNFSLPEEWDPYDDDSGDLIPDEALPDTITAVAKPADPVSGFELFTGRFVMEGGLPSENLAPRVPEYPGRMAPADAERMGIGEHGTLRLSRQGRELDVAVKRDERIPLGRIYLPMGIETMLVNTLGTGSVEVLRREEVHTS